MTDKVEAKSAIFVKRLSLRGVYFHTKQSDNILCFFLYDLTRLLNIQIVSLEPQFYYYYYYSTIAL